MTHDYTYSTTDGMMPSYYKSSVGSLKEFWEDRGKTGSFERGYHIRFEGVSKMVDKISEFIDGKRVLDIGCGPGIVVSLFPRNSEVIGLDFSISMLKGAKSRIQQLMRGSALDLPFRDEVFEVATCFFVASDYYAKDGIFMEAFRVLEGNGVFLFADYSPNDEHWMLKRRIHPLLGESCDIFIESEESLSSRLARAGFEVQKVEPIRFAPAFELGRYIRSEKEMGQLKETGPSLWEYIQDRMASRKIRREFILVISEKQARVF